MQCSPPQIKLGVRVTHPASSSTHYEIEHLVKKAHKLDVLCSAPDSNTRLRFSFLRSTAKGVIKAALPTPVSRDATEAHRLCCVWDGQHAGFTDDRRRSV